MWNTARLAVAGRFDELARHNNYRLTIHTRSRGAACRAAAAAEESAAP